MFNLKITDIGNNMVLIEGKCIVTKKPYSVKTYRANYDKYNAGVHAQHAFPDLDADDREFIISGISPEGWNLTFGEEE